LRCLTSCSGYRAGDARDLDPQGGSHGTTSLPTSGPDSPPRHSAWSAWSAFESLTVQAMAAHDLIGLRRRRVVGQTEAGLTGLEADEDGWVVSEVGVALALSDRQAHERLASARCLAPLDSPPAPHRTTAAQTTK
jgi:RNase P/RNase MRP subunit p29